MGTKGNSTRQGKGGNLLLSPLNHLIAGIFCFCGVALFPSEIVGELGLMRFFERGKADAYVP